MIFQTQEMINNCSLILFFSIKERKEGKEEREKERRNYKHSYRNGSAVGSTLNVLSMLSFLFLLYYR